MRQPHSLEEALCSVVVVFDMSTLWVTMSRVTQNILDPYSAIHMKNWENSKKWEKFESTSALSPSLL